MLLRDFSVRFGCPSARSRTVLLITVIVTALNATASSADSFQDPPHKKKKYQNTIIKNSKPTRQEESED